MSHFDTPPDPFALNASDSPDARWRGYNEFGVMLATDGHWVDARQAFADALEAAPAFAEVPAVHAVLLSNFAQACFYTGDVDEAVRTARRSLSARLLCADEHDAPMARSRSDLAVYLAASGALDEAQATLHHAMYSLTNTFGGEHEHLAVPRENAARLAQVLAARDASLQDTTETTQGDENAAPHESAAAFSISAEQDAIDVFPLSTSGDTDEYALEFVEELPPPPLRAETASVPSRIAGFEGHQSDDAPPVTPPTPARPAGLGFEIQYGVPPELLLDGGSD